MLLSRRITNKIAHFAWLFACVWRQLTTSLQGALSGALAWAASFPLDSVCTRVMCNTSSNQPHAFALIRNMLLTTNIATLYSGVGVSMGRAAIVSSTRFTTYEYIRGMT